MRSIIFFNLFICLLTLFGCSGKKQQNQEISEDEGLVEDNRPNILFAIADDMSWLHAGFAGCEAIQTPNIDYLARNGVWFNHAYCSAPSCSASRASILTGRNGFELREGACLWSIIPSEFKTYTEYLEESGYTTGYTGKGWGPGDWEEAFEPQIEGDRLYGRGATDDKAAIVSIFLAIKTLQRLGIRLSGDFETHLTNEEEVGMAGALAFVREGFKADGVLVLEPTDHNIYIANRGCLQFKIHVEGKQAHLGQKRHGVSAIEKAAKIIDALVRYEDRLIEEGRGYPLFEEFEYPGQVNVGIIRGGDFFSIVPDSVTMDGGIGFLPKKKMNEVEKELLDVIANIDDPWLRGHCQVYFNGLKNEPYQMPLNHPFTNALKQTLHSLGRTPKIGGMMATCDARYYFNQGDMPSIVYGGTHQSLSHSKNEYAEITDVLETAVDYAAFLIDWCGIYA